MIKWGIKFVKMKARTGEKEIREGKESLFYIDQY